MKFLCLALLAIATTATAAPRVQVLRRLRREEAVKFEEAKPAEAEKAAPVAGGPGKIAAEGDAQPAEGEELDERYGHRRPGFSQTSYTHTSIGGGHRPGGYVGGNQGGYQGGLGGGYAGGIGGAYPGAGNLGYGYQQGQGYGGANVQFANIGPNGRPALEYQAPGISISLREKEQNKEAAKPAEAVGFES